MKIFFISLILSPLMVIARSDLTLNYLKDDKPIKITFVSVGKARVDSTCAKKPKTCEALKAFNGKPAKQQKSKSVAAGNPASNYCWDIGAQNSILKAGSGDQYDACVFKDGSLIDSWSLYYHHFGK